MDLSSLSRPTRVDLLVAFADLENFAGLARAVGDELALFDLMEGFSRAFEPPVLAAGGTVVKWIGDAALLAFGRAEASRGARAILAAKEAAESWLRGRGFPNRLRISAHVGECVAGPFGSAGRLDLYGEVVNLAATLDRGRHPGSLALSAETFRSLDAETRRLFRRWRAPDIYLGGKEGT